MGRSSESSHSQDDKRTDTQLNQTHEETTVQRFAEC